MELGFNPLVAPESEMDSDPPIPGNGFADGVCVTVMGEGMRRVTVVPAATPEELVKKVVETSGLKIVEEPILKDAGTFISNDAKLSYREDTTWYRDALSQFHERIVNLT